MIFEKYFYKRKLRSTKGNFIDKDLEAFYKDKDATIYIEGIESEYIKLLLDSLTEETKHYTINWLYGEESPYPLQAHISFIDNYEDVYVTIRDDLRDKKYKPELSNKDWRSYTFILYAYNSSNGDKDNEPNRIVVSFKDTVENMEHRKSIPLEKQTFSERTYNEIVQSLLDLVMNIEIYMTLFPFKIVKDV